jgi:RNA polymerase sigma-70 factor (ECF subfamily)
MADKLQKKPTEDRQLIYATLHGDNSAFGTIVGRHWNMVIALALSKIDESAEAEDIAQESFLKAYSHLHNLNNPSQFIGWLSKIVMQECSNNIRKNIRFRSALGSRTTSFDDFTVFTKNPGLTHNQIHFVRQAVRKLPEKFRKLIIMRFVAGLSTVQIAEQLGKRPGTVRVWLHRAYKILRRDLAPLLEEVRQ